MHAANDQITGRENREARKNKRKNVGKSENLTLNMIKMRNHYISILFIEKIIKLVVKINTMTTSISRCSYNNRIINEQTESSGKAMHFSQPLHYQNSYMLLLFLHNRINLGKRRNNKHVKQEEINK